GGAWLEIHCPGRSRRGPGRVRVHGRHHPHGGQRDRSAANHVTRPLQLAVIRRRADADDVASGGERVAGASSPSQSGPIPVNTASASSELRDLPVLLGGNPDTLKEWAARWEFSRDLGYVAVIVAGAGVYGAAMGYWRSPVQAGYNLVKFPLVILTTTLGNALINGMLAPLLGLDLRLRQSLMLVLMSF